MKLQRKNPTEAANAMIMVVSTASVGLMVMAGVLDWSFSKSRWTHNQVQQRNHKIVGLADGTGCAIALVSGGCYSYFMMKLNDAKAAAKKAAADANDAGQKA